MGAKVDIPQVFTPADPAALKRDLERFAQGVYKYTQDAAAGFVSFPVPSPASVLAFGTVTRVSLVAGDSLVLQLPQPDVKNGGKSLSIKRETTTGSCKIRGVGALINGRPSQLLPAALGMYSVFFDGTNYYSTQPLAADWSP